MTLYLSTLMQLFSTGGECSFDQYFPDFEHDSPVIAHNRNLLEQSLDLTHDSSTKASFVDEILTELGSMLRRTCSSIVLKPLQLLTAFQSIYTCELTFSSAVAVKVKSRHRLFDMESDLRCVISKIKLNITCISSEMQTKNPVDFVRLINLLIPFFFLFYRVSWIFPKNWKKPMGAKFEFGVYA